MTAPAAHDLRDARRVVQLHGLIQEPATGNTGQLSDVVGRHLNELWSSGLQPDWIWLRLPYVSKPPTSHYPPNLPNLIQTRGLQLRFHLLMLFEAQCRYGTGARVTGIREIEPTADADVPSWRELVLTATAPSPDPPGRPRSSGPVRSARRPRPSNFATSYGSAETVPAGVVSTAR